MIRISGINPVAEAIKSGKRPIETVFLSRKRERSGRIRYIYGLATDAGVSVKYVPESHLDRMCGKKHQGTVAIIGLVQYRDWKDALEPGFPVVLYLDRVTDCGNLGAIIRSAAAFGLDWVILGEKDSAPVNETAINTSAGGAEYVNFAKARSPLQMIRAFQENDFRIVCIETGGQSIDDYAPAQDDRILLVLGGEEKGIRDSLLKECDHTLTIPMSSRIASLNVSVSAGIALRETIEKLKQAGALS